MDSVTLVVTALTTGASADPTDVGGAATKDACAGLRRLLIDRFGGYRGAAMALGGRAGQPQVWRAPLVKVLTDTGAASDPQVRQAAQRVMMLADEEGSRAGAYVVPAPTRVDVHAEQGEGRPAGRRS